jgi:hypothetical protein
MSKNPTDEAFRYQARPEGDERCECGQEALHGYGIYDTWVVPCDENYHGRVAHDYVSSLEARRDARDMNGGKWPEWMKQAEREQAR